MDIETTRQALLDEIYAGAFAGMPTMLTLEEEVKTADTEQLMTLAEQLGITLLL